MKRLVDLTPADLDQVPVWRYSGENDDVAHVRATDRGSLEVPEVRAFIARTQFHLASGAQFLGFCSPCEDRGLDSLQPVILTADGPVFFYFEEPPSHESLQTQWRRLGSERELVFPIHYRCTVPVSGHYVTGTIEANDLTGAA